MASKNLQPHAAKKTADDGVGVANSAVSATEKSTNIKAKNQASPNTEAKEKPVDFRYVRHGDGPCACCGPWSE